MQDNCIGILVFHKNEATGNKINFLFICEKDKNKINVIKL